MVKLILYLLTVLLMLGSAYAETQHNGNTLVPPTYVDSQYAIKTSKAFSFAEQICMQLCDLFSKIVDYFLKNSQPISELVMDFKLFLESSNFIIKFGRSNYISEFFRFILQTCEF